MFLQIPRSIRRFSLVVAVLLLPACGTSLTKETDETENWSAEQLYRAAKTQLKLKNYEAAIDYFEKLEGRYPYGKFVQQAQLDIAYSYYQDDNQDLAMASIERFIHLHPAHPSVDYAYYLKGLISFNIKRGTLDFLLKKQDYADRNPEAMKKAYEAFRELVERFPSSRYSVDGRKRLTYLRNLLAKHEIYVARYYFDRKAYVATVNRTKYVLENFQRTPATREALELQVQAYTEMGLDKLAADAERVLELNYPDSEVLQRDRKKPGNDQATKTAG